ncbi:hypothetical protein E2562_032694 [Oryza meyeriana var. granulata]|uniref:Uncharacterized protein n=1 Tax=Oryza meyeriana var. granulata TaxID=110450 RepID=A0A6G1FF75_9ORYZ|nr:hypothetical protein E2562_032694 [Oryza meyeriana var. granulata]
MATKVLDKLTVAASPPAAGGVLPLTFFDVPWLFTGPVERVFFYSYPHPVDHFTAHLLPSLVSSLSAALHGFYPLLGRVRPCPDGGGGYEFCSTGGDADRVELTVAESSYDFEELSGGGPRDVGRLYSLVPQLPRPEDGSFALAAVQVTVFPGKGLAVGVSIHHVACDDSSFMHFVKTWAGHCRVAAGGDAAVVPPPPFLDRGVVADPDGLAAKTLDQMRQLAASGPPPPPPSGPPPKLLMASFTLTRDCIDKLKQRVTASGGCGVHCSAFTVACAYAWACLVRVDGTSAGRERAHLLFSVECRRRLTPPVLQEYLGNCLRPCFVEVDMAGLLGANGVVTAAVGIGASIRGLDDGVLDGADGWFHKIMSMMPHRPMSVGGSPRYGVYDTDFGLGRPRKVELLSIDKTPGTVSMAEGCDRQGGIEIGVALPEAEMEQFCSCFSDGLKQL